MPESAVAFNFALLGVFHIILICFTCSLAAMPVVAIPLGNVDWHICSPQWQDSEVAACQEYSIFQYEQRIKCSFPHCQICLRRHM